MGPMSTQTVLTINVTSEMAANGKGREENGREGTMQDKRETERGIRVIKAGEGGKEILFAGKPTSQVERIQPQVLNEELITQWKQKDENGMTSPPSVKSFCLYFISLSQHIEYG